jgi:hypothetical protein
MRASCATVLVLFVAGCGGGDDSPATSSPKPKPGPGPPIASVIGVARANAGFKGCKEVAPGAEQRPTAASDPKLIQALLCDGQIVGNYFVYRNPADAARYVAKQDRPTFVNGTIVVTTGEAFFAKQFDADGARTLPDELAKSCGCGQVHRP